MTSEKILIINDQQPVRWTLNQAVQNWGFVPIEATTVDDAIELVNLHHPAATLLDISFRDVSGLDILRQIRGIHRDAVVIIVTGKAVANEAILDLYADAYDFFATPINLEGLQESIRNGIESAELQSDARQLDHAQIKSFGFHQIIGDSTSIRETKLLAQKVASSNISCVLLQGESGTGKDLIAKAIHYSSSRSRKPFVAINCAAIPASLLESELFGFEKGAFTDAKARKEGLFEQAEGGTLFLDEIGELEIGLQAKLLRVLEEGAFRRVGGLRDLPLDVRVIGASNRNLRTESEAKRFRSDLFYRLSVIQIDVPPLRQRGDDILLLTDHFIKTLDQNQNESVQRKLSADVAEAFKRYRWPGNVRELRNAIERALLLEDGEQITMKFMPRELTGSYFASNSSSNGEHFEASMYISLPAEGISLDMVEMWLIQEALHRSGGNVTRASELLRVPRDRIRYRLKKTKLDYKNIQNLDSESYKQN